MNYKIISVLFWVLFSFSLTGKGIDKEVNVPTTKTDASNLKSDIDLEIEQVFVNLKTNNCSLPKLESFKKALTGFYELKRKGLVKKDILTLIDFSLSSNTKRLWVIDLKTNTILYHSLVAHGRNTGEEFANRFSNAAESFKSSLGFYLTGELYNGKHGVSLRLDGLEKGVNDNARARGVVMHAAHYVSNGFVKLHKRLGRSQGCPALPDELTKEIVTTIKDKSCLFIYHPSRDTQSLDKLVS